MLCSHSTTSIGSGATKYTGGLSWLDRLRISKGFPIHHPDLDLDYFLHNSQHSDLNPIPDIRETTCKSQIDRLAPIIRVKKAKNGDKEGEGKVKEGQLLDLMSIALAELFRIGDPEEYRRMSDHKHRKNCRKQLNPKSCVVSTFPKVGGCNVGVPVALSPSPAADTTTTTVRVKRNKLIDKKIIGKKRAVCEDESLDPEFTPPPLRTEMTVIDSNYGPDWKSEKIVSTKENVSRIQDKKLRNLSKKKKMRLNLVENMVGGGGKEQNLDLVGEVDADKDLVPTKTIEVICA